MKEPEQLLDHAFSLARRARDPIRSDLPFGMETAVLAHWRNSSASSRSDVGILRIFRWSAIAACVIAVASGVWMGADIAHLSRPMDPETTVVDYAVAAGLDG
jgi:hypothetical protein